MNKEINKINGIICPNPKCKSKNLRLSGKVRRRNKDGTGVIKIQRYECLDCGYNFTIEHKRRKVE